MSTTLEPGRDLVCEAALAGSLKDHAPVADSLSVTSTETIRAYMARIHIVDDDPDIRQLVSYWLVEEGHEVSAAPDGDAALEKVVADPPDLLILDMMMPRLDGYEVLKNVAAAGVLERMKVLVLSARSSEQDRELGLELGADLYVNKPFEPEELVGVVNEMLALTKAQLRDRREEERDKARLLSQLETFFDN